VTGVRLSDSRSEGRFRAELESWLAENEPAADRLSDPPLRPGTSLLGPGLAARCSTPAGGAALAGSWAGGRPQSSR
jgi:hypothetical protein